MGILRVFESFGPIQNGQNLVARTVEANSEYTFAALHARGLPVPLHAAIWPAYSFGQAGAPTQAELALIRVAVIVDQLASPFGSGLQALPAVGLRRNMVARNVQIIVRTGALTRGIDLQSAAGLGPEVAEAVTGDTATLVDGTSQLYTVPAGCNQWRAVVWDGVSSIQASWLDLSGAAGTLPAAFELGDFECWSPIPSAAGALSVAATDGFTVQFGRV